MAADDLIAIGQVALLLGVSRQRADQLSRQAGFPPVAVEGAPMRLWREEEVETWCRGYRRRPRRSRRLERTRRRA